LKNSDGLGFQVKVLEAVRVVPVSLESGRVWDEFPTAISIRDASPAYSAIFSATCLRRANMALKRQF